MKSIEPDDLLPHYRAASSALYDMMLALLAMSDVIVKAHSTPTVEELEKLFQLDTGKDTQG